MNHRRDVGEEAWRLVERLYPLARSLTGDGVRATFAILAEHAPLEVHEVPTGTAVLDWTVPQEWNVREAWIAGPDGARVVDVRDHTLHLMSYSTPVHTQMNLQELRPHLYSLPEQPDLIPYRTSFYEPRWGFCLPHRQLEALPEGEYEVCVDTTLEDGHLSYAEIVLPGAGEHEVLLHAHSCHPSLANDNCSSLALATLLAHELADRENRYTYRFVFAPATIGAITWLARNENVLPWIRHGLVLAGTGDPGPLSYKRSRRGDATIDRAVEVVLRDFGAEASVEAFSPWGYDERQYCSPGYDLPVGRLSRTPHGRYLEYHTSADNLSFVRPQALANTYDALLAIIDVLEGDRLYRNVSPRGEPQLGRRGLYASVGTADRREAELALLWVLNLCDGSHSLLGVAERSGIPFTTVRRAADALLAHELLSGPDMNEPEVVEGPGVAV